MAVITPQLKMNKFVEGLFNKRTANKIIKESLYLAADFWYNEILPIHFTYEAYTKYPNEYSSSKSITPMDKTGQMMKNVFSGRKISGTSKQAKVRFNFGVPKPKSQAQLKASAWYLVKKLNIDYKKALRKAALRQGNYGKNIDKFKLQSTAVDSEDVEKIATFIKDYVIEQYDKGRKGTRKRQVKAL